MSSRLPGIDLVLDASEACGENSGLQKVGVHSAIRQTHLEPARLGDADHVGAVIAGIGNRVRGPGGAGDGARRVDALIAVHGRIGDGRQRIGMLDNTANEVIAELRNAQIARCHPQTGFPPRSRARHAHGSPNP